MLEEESKSNWFRDKIVVVVCTGVFVGVIMLLINSGIKSMETNKELEFSITKIESNYHDNKKKIAVGKYINGMRMIDASIPLHQDSPAYRFSLLNGSIEIRREIGKIDEIYLLFLGDKIEKNIDSSDFFQTEGRVKRSV